MSDRIDTTRLRDTFANSGVRTHYDGCEYDHRDCAIVALCDEIDRLRKACEAAYAVLNGDVRDEVEPGAPSGAVLNMLHEVLGKRQQGGETR